MMPLGEVKEREPVAPKGMTISVGKSGFPSYPKATSNVVVGSGGAMKNVVVQEPKQKFESKVKTEKQEILTDMKDIKESDLKSLMRDNNNEILEEISSILSPEMIQFLTNRELKKHQEETKQKNVAHNENTSDKKNNNSILSNRFDLNGNLIILNQDVLIQNIQESLKNNSLLTNISTKELQNASLYIYEQVLSVGYISYNVCIENEPELYGHQENPDLPGYTWDDIIELYRSEVPMQRSISLRIINGILNIRDMFSITECVGYDINRNFHTIYNNLLSHLRGINNFEFSSNLYTKKLRRLITYVLLKHFSSDLPTTLPTLILWGLTIKSITLTNIKLNTIKMLHHFLSCQIEEQINLNLYNYYDHLYISLPKLVAPHSRRPEISYEELYQDSISSINNINDDENNISGDNTSGDLNHELLAYNCRHNRIDTFVHESDVIERITIILNDILKYILTVSNKILLIDNEMNMTLNIVIYILQIYRFCVRLGDDATVQKILHCIRVESSKYILLFINEMHTNDNNSYSFVDLILKSNLFVQFECNWWHLIIEGCKRDSTFVAWLWNTDVIKKYQWIKIINELCQQNSTMDLYTWLIRFFRISVLNKCGHDTVLNIIMNSTFISQLEIHDSILWAIDSNYGGELLFLLMEIYHFSYKNCIGDVFPFIIRCHSLVTTLFDMMQNNKLTKNHVVACMHFIATILESDIFSNSVDENLKNIYDIYNNNLTRLVEFLLKNQELIDEICNYESIDEMSIIQFKIAYNRCLAIYFTNHELNISKKLYYEKYENIVTILESILPNLSIYNAARVIPVCEGLQMWKLYHLNSIYSLSKLNLLYQLYDNKLFNVTHNVWINHVLQSIESFGNNMEHVIYILLKELLMNETINNDIFERISNNLTIDMNHQYINLTINEIFKTIYTLKYDQVKFNKNLPLLNTEWIFQQLYKLDGESFQYLLQLLIKIIDNNNCNIDSSILLYNLLVLVQDEHSFRWYINIIEPISNDNANMFLAYEPNNNAVQLYYNSLLSLIKLNYCNWKLVDNFLNYCDIKWRKENIIQRKSNKKYREFIMNIMDAISRQSIDPLLHSLVGIYLISPLFPVTIRFIIWKELSHLRIIHVLESNATIKLLPLYLISYHPWNTSNSLYFDFYDTIITGITNGISRGNDIKSSIIINLGIFEITKFIYNNNDNELISDIFMNNMKYPDWLFKKILSLLYIADKWNSMLITTTATTLSNENWDLLCNNIHEILCYNIEIFSEDIVLQIQKKLNTTVDIISLYNLYRAH